MGFEIAANLLAGLALLFIGIKLIGENMKQMAGLGFRRFLSRITRSLALTVLSGVLAGALVQSATAVTFILTSLVSSRLIGISASLPIIAWANIGNSLIVLLAAVDLRLIALFLIAGIGVCYYTNLDKSNRYRAIVGAGLGLGTLLLGLIFMKAGAAPLKQVAWLSQFLSYTKNSYLLAFLFAVGVTLVAQSSTTVVVLGISLARAGLLGPEQTVMIIYGSNLGSGLSVWFMSSNLRGSTRQLPLYQALFKVAGAAVLVVVFYAETYFHIPGVLSMVRALSHDFGTQMAYVFLLFQLVSAAVLAILPSLVLRLMEAICPASTEEALNRPQFIYEQALEEPETALNLAEKDCLRLVGYLPQFLDAIREETRENVRLQSGVLSTAVLSVSGEVKTFVTHLIGCHPSEEGLQRALNLERQFDLICSLSTALNEFACLSRESRGVEKLFAFSQQSSEALHMILVTLAENMELPDEVGCSVLQELTSDRSETMLGMRRSLARENSMDPQYYQTLLALTCLFERIVWLINQLGQTTRPARVNEVIDASPAS